MSVLGLIGESATQPLLDNLTELAPGPAQEIVTSAIENLETRTRVRPGSLFVVGLATALWSASGYVGAFMRASNSIYEVEEGRPFWKLRPRPDRDHARDDGPGLDRRHRGGPHRPARGGRSAT